DAGVKTIVIGVGDDVKSSQCLDTLGRTGLTRSGSAGYAWAGDEMQLAQLMRTAMVSVSTCALRLSGVLPESTDRLSIAVSGAAVPRDPALKEGWSPDPVMRNRIVFYGSWCDRIRSGVVQERDVTVTVHCSLCPGMISLSCR